MTRYIIKAFDGIFVPVSTPDTSKYAENIKKAIMMSNIPDKHKHYMLMHLTSKYVSRISRMESVDSSEFNIHSKIILDDRGAFSRFYVMSVLFRKHFYVSTNKNYKFVSPHIPVYGNVWTFWYGDTYRNFPAVSLIVHNCMPHYYIHTSASKVFMTNDSNINRVTRVVQCLYEAFKRTPEAIKEHVSIRLTIQKRRKRFEDEVQRLSLELPEHISYMTIMGDSILNSLVESAEEIARKSASNVMSEITSSIVELIISGYKIKPVPKNLKVPDGYIPLFIVDTEIYPKAIRRYDMLYQIPDELYRKYEVNKNLYVRGLAICNYGGEYRQVALEANHPNINGRTRAVCDFSASKNVKDAVYNAINELQVCNLDSCFGNEAEAYCRWLLRTLKKEHGIEGAQIHFAHRR